MVISVWRKKKKDVNIFVVNNTILRELRKLSLQRLQTCYEAPKKQSKKKRSLEINCLRQVGSF